MADRKRLSASNIRYLIHMKRLEREDGSIRSVDIASALGCTKPSVHKMMEFFIQSGYLKKDPYGAGRFTEEGDRIASRCCRYYQAVEKRIGEDFPHLNDVQNVVCTILAEAAEEDLRRVWKKEDRMRAEEFREDKERTERDQNSFAD